MTEYVIELLCGVSHPADRAGERRFVTKETYQDRCNPSERAIIDEHLADTFKTRDRGETEIAFLTHEATVEINEWLAL